MYSALKSKRLCDLARENTNIETLEEICKSKSRVVIIDEFETIEQITNNIFDFKVICSKGTYVRSLATDLSAILNTCGYTCYLHRVGVGNFKTNDELVFNNFNCDNQKIFGFSEDEKGRIVNCFNFNNKGFESNGKVVSYGNFYRFRNLPNLGDNYEKLKINMESDSIYGKRVVYEIRKDRAKGVKEVCFIQDNNINNI